MSAEEQTRQRSDTGYRGTIDSQDTEDLPLVTKKPLGNFEYDEENRVIHLTSKCVKILGTVFFLLTIAFVTTLVLFLLNLPSAKMQFNQFDKHFSPAVQPNSLRDFIKNYSAVPHLAGTPQNYEEALFTQAHWKDYGFQTRIEEHSVLLTYPIQRSVHVISPYYECTLKEDVVPDGTSNNKDIIPTWNGWSASGTAEGELVYVNYGSQEDFDQLKNINFTGTIVIARYGEIFRGNKALVAQLKGAVAVLIYTDPADYAKGPAYPKGPWASNTTVQRGAVWTGNGDPLTPGWTSTDGGPRISLKEAQEGGSDLLFTTLPNIPIQPLSYGDAQHLLRGLGNNPLPLPNWSGGLNITHVGPGPVRVNVTVNVSFNSTKIHNVIGIIEGSMWKDRPVLIGSHRDAWTLGAVDPISGHSILMETARVFGTLLAAGWKPLRSIVLCSWDAEEYGLIGSIEFTEKWNKFLSSSAVAYLNLDTAVTGGEALQVEGTPALKQLISRIAKSIKYQSPTKYTSLYDVWTPPDVTLLGSGSDYTGFIQRLGIPCLNFEMVNSSASASYGSVYHSSYDSFYWVSNFSDPQFTYHAALTKLFGEVTMALSDTPVLPFDYTDYASHLTVQFLQLQNRSLDLGFPLNFTLFQSSIDYFTKAAQTVSAETNQLLAEVISKPNILTETSRVDALNDRLTLTERTFLGDKFLSADKYYLHVVSTPSASNAYGGSSFPSIYQAVSEKDLGKAQFLMDRIALIIQEAADFLGSAFIR